MYYLFHMVHVQKKSEWKHYAFEINETIFNFTDTEIWNTSLLKNIFLESA